MKKIKDQWIYKLCPKCICQYVYQLPRKVNYCELCGSLLELINSMRDKTVIKKIMYKTDQNNPAVKEYVAALKVGDKTVTWEEEFDEAISNVMGIMTIDSIKIKDFIRSVLQKQREEILGDIKTLFLKEEHPCRFNDGEQSCDCYYEALSKVFKIIKRE